MLVGFVLVSHSYALAAGGAELARQRGGPAGRIATAGGPDLPDHPIGTDAVMVMGAVERAWSLFCQSLLASNEFLYVR